MGTINGTAGNDALAGTTSADTINGLDGNDILYGDAGNDVLNGGNGDDFLEGGAGNDTMDGGTGFNFATYTVATSGVTVSLAITTAQNTGGAGTDTLVNIQGLAGSDFNDVLTGDAGDNILDGRGGLDALHGGAGSDTIQVSSISDFVPGETYDGGAGYDVLTLPTNSGQFDLSQSTVTGIEEFDALGDLVIMTPGQLGGMVKVQTNGITLTTAGTVDLHGAVVNVNEFTLQGAATLDLSGSTGPAHIVYGSAGDDHILGGNGGDTLHGNGGNDVVTGGSGNDFILGDDDSGPGNDVLNGGDGNDEMHGGAGDSTAGLPGNDTLNGDGGNDTLYGDSGGTDILNGGPGDDTIIENGMLAGVSGGPGDDALTINFPDSLVAGLVINGGSGDDTVTIPNDGENSVNDLTRVIFRSVEHLTAGYVRMTVGQLTAIPDITAPSVSVAGSGSLHLGGAIDTPGAFTIESARVTLDLGGFSAHGVAVQGSIHGDVVVGTSGGDLLDGNGGNDILSDGGGNNTIDGGTGNDHLTGGAGTDQITGDDGNDIISGGGGDDFINGGAGNDTIDGGTGTNFINGGDGIDTASYAAATAGVTVSLETTNPQDTVGAGTDALTSIENLIGSAFADTLQGNGAGNVIEGLGGNDTIDLTFGGAETASGGDGDDLFLMGAYFSASDRIDGGSGNDALSLAGDYSAGVTLKASTLANVETISLAGGDSYKLTTNDANVAAGRVLQVDGSALGASDHLTFNGSAELDGRFALQGGAGSDTLVGGMGADTITGGLGADSLAGGGGADVFRYATAADSTGAGYDTVTGFDFSSGDTFDVPGKVSAINAAIAAGALSAATFDADLAAAIGGGQLSKHHAVLFTPAAGDLAGQTFLVIDLNGQTGYQAGADLVIHLAGAANLASIGVADFT